MTCKFFSDFRNALTAVKQLYSLKKMKNSSEQEKPGLSTTGSVQCMVCNKFFRGGSYLRQHMRTHTGEPNFKYKHRIQCSEYLIIHLLLSNHFANIGLLLFGRTTKALFDFYKMLTIEKNYW